MNECLLKEQAAKKVAFCATARRTKTPLLRVSAFSFRLALTFCF
jgi:hypothetical protein